MTMRQKQQHSGSRAREQARQHTCIMTSGAIQNGVPTNVLCLAIVCDNRALTPKSASFTWPSAVTMMLAHCDGRGEGAGRGWNGVAP